MQYARPFFDQIHIHFVFNQTLNAYTVLFIISTLLRAGAIIIFLPLIRGDESISMRFMASLFVGKMKRAFNRL